MKTNAIVAILATFSLASCGGTISLKPDGTWSYTTPILKAPIIQPAK